MVARRSLDFLPSVFRTTTNKRFLNATVDQLIQEPAMTRMAGYIGRAEGSSTYKTGDAYIQESDPFSQYYQLEPSLVVRQRDTVLDKSLRIDNAYSYLDMLNKLSSNGAITDNHDRMFRQEYYNYQGFVDIEKLVNYRNYFWIPNGPDSIDIYAGDADFQKTFFVSIKGTGISSDELPEIVTTDYGHNISGFGTDLNPTITLVRGGSYQFEVGQKGFPFYIQTEAGDIDNATDSVTWQQNISKREVKGVDNNGTDSGTIVFNVPRKDAQDGFIKMPEIPAIDYVIDIPFNQVQNCPLNLFYSLGNTFDSVYINQTVKRVIFTDTSDENWFSPGNYSNDAFDSTSFDQGTAVEKSQRKGVWQMKIDDDGLIKCIYLEDLPSNYKTFVKQGAKYGNRYFYKDGVGTLKLVPVITANLDTLYYQTANFGAGEIKLIEADLTTSLKIDDIVGKKNYTSPNGIRFTNGLKVRFTNLVDPESYKGNEYLVEGVGKAIKLIKWKDMVTPEPYSTSVGSGYDSSGENYDSTNYDATLNAPIYKEYISVNKASTDGNPWTRGNRWFHKDVLDYVASVLTPGQGYSFDEAYRAKRPIIEFLPDLLLFDGASGYAGPIDVIDVSNLDAFSNIEGTAGAYIDGVALNTGVRVVFAEDTDPNVRNRIFVVNRYDRDGQGDYRVHLEPLRTVAEGESIVVVSGVNRQGEWWRYENGAWQIGQQKTSINQAPLFDVFVNGYSFGDKSVYPGSSFSGSKLFSFKPGSTTDSEMGIPISYRSLGNIGDILFQNDFAVDSFIYNASGTDVTLQVKDGNPNIKNSSGIYVSKNPWTTVADPSKQFIEQKFTATLNRKNDFALNCLFETSRTERNVFVWVNGVATQDFSLYDDSYRNRTILHLASDLAVNDRVIVKLYGTPVTQKNFYTVPKNLEKNSFNDDFDSITLGQMREHLAEMSRNCLLMQGDSNGDNNLRDINYVSSAGSILQHSGPYHLAQLLINNGSTDVIASIDHSGREYQRFKDKFFDLLVNTQFNDPNNSREVVDTILRELNAGTNSLDPYYYTDMVAFGSDYVKTSYTVLNVYDRTYNAVNAYGFNSQYDSAGDPYKTLLVYRKRGTGLSTQLLKDRDYSVTGRIISLAADFDQQQDDVIEIYEYTNTKGCRIPATPSKLGLYPRFFPSIYEDSTYLDPITVIEGHDGSIMPAFGDFRDQAILELEYRIYNNIRVDYSSTLSDHRNAEPGAFRQTGYSYDEWTQLLSSSFSSWAGEHNLDVFTNNIVSNDLFSLNYAQGTDRLFDELLPGYWRAIYKYFYDTDRPHTAPWEMLGYSEKPVYWESKYGPAPYTAGNLVMWGDLEAGAYYEDTSGDGQYITKKVNNLYMRPGLTQILPVDEHGFLLPPQTAVIGRYNQLTGTNDWRFGDQGPVETAWRRSSSYPFAVMIAYALARPAEFASYTFNVRDYARDPGLGQIINTRNNNRKTSSVISDDTNLVPGTNVWIRDRLAYLGLDIDRNLVYLIEDSTLNLVYKMSGFSDKQFLQVIAEQSSPNSLNSGIMIPQENYNVVLTKSAPTSRCTYSAVIVEKQSDGYSIRGFDNTKPYFYIIPSIQNNNNYSLEVNGATGTVYRDGDDKYVSIPYGTYLSSKQQVVDFLVSYGRYLESQGFRFDLVLKDNSTRQDWTLAVKEFLFFTTQNWDDNTVISLTPAGSQIDFNNGYAVVDSLTNSFNNTRVVNSDNKVVPPSDYRIYRSDTQFQIFLRDTTKGIHLIDLVTVQNEHSLVFDNLTVFNDVIYQANLGSRQQRLKVIGRKTSNWNGSLYAPGFLINNNIVDEWATQTDYYKGDIVKHKTKYFTANTFIPASNSFDQNLWFEISDSLIKNKLIPNPAFNSQQFEGFYDIDTQDVNVLADMQARHATGYQPRQYLTDIGLDVVSQHKFYLGMITEKGTKSSFDKFLRAKLPYLQNQVTIAEEWAIKVGDYGATNNVDQIEVSLGSIHTNNEIAVIEFLENNQVRNPLWNTFKPKDLNYVPAIYNKDLFAETTKTSTLIPKTGPVMLDEVAITVFDVNKIENVSSYAAVMGEGSRIWVAADKDNDWNIYRASNDYGLYATRVTKINGSEIEFATARPHGLQLRDKVLIKNAYVRAATNGASSTADVSGIYRVIAITQNSFRVMLNPGVEVQSGAVRALVFKMQSVRYDDRPTFALDTPYKGWKSGDKVYIDNSVEGGWQVLENIDAWKYIENQSPSTVTSGDDFGRQVAVSKNQRAMVISSAEDNGKVYVYGLDDFGNWNLLEGVQAADSYSATFGYSVSLNDDDKILIGDPGAFSDTGFVYVMKSSAGLTEFDQVIYNDNLSPGAEFGSSVAASKDGNWLYVSAADAVEAYKLIKVSEPVQEAYTGDGSTQTFLLPLSIRLDGLSSNQVKVFVSGELQVPELDYSMNGPQTGITFTTPPDVDQSILIDYSDYYYYVDTIPNPSSGNGFGSKVVTSTDGAQILITAPNEDAIKGTSTVSDVGAVYVFKRTVENFVGDGETVQFDTAYYINTSTVYVDGQMLDSSAYSEFPYNVVLDTAPDASSVVTVESNEFQLIQKLQATDANQGQEYGTDAILCPNNCSVYVGSPFYSTSSGDQGAVFRHVNIPKIYGKIVGTVQDPVITPGSEISINDYYVALVSGSDLVNIVDDINSAGIPGITASSTADNRLVIETDSTVTFNKLTITDITPGVMEDLGTQMYQEVQRIDSIYQEDGLSFGESLAINPTADVLLVGTTKSSSYAYTTFDNNSTSFDTSSTQYKEKLARSGSVFVYEYQTSASETPEDIGRFAFAKTIHNEDMSEHSEFGRNMAISNNWMFVASPRAMVNSEVKGAFFIYQNSSASKIWNVIRSKPTNIDSKKIQKAYIYNDNLTVMLAELPVVDMSVGKLLPDAAVDIDFMTNYDPATYNNVPVNIGFTFDKKTAWGREHVGKLWWDINSVKYLDWHQGDLLSRSTLRDIAFPSSTYAVYEWIESSVSPSEYNKAMSAKGLEPLYTKNEVYSSITESDPATGLLTTRYYFWIKHRPNVIEAGNDKVSTMTRMLANPRATKIPFISVIGSNSVALYNCSDLFEADNVLRIVYDLEQDDVKTHTEWSIFKDESRLGLNESIFNKLVDSIAEQDAQGRIVPDLNLGLAQRFGLDVRPRQSAFVNPVDAKKLLHNYANTFFLKYPIRLVRSLEAFNSFDPYPESKEYDDAVDTDVELGYLDQAIYVNKKVFVKNDSTTGGWTLRKLLSSLRGSEIVYDWSIIKAQTYDNRSYWEYVDWYSEGFSADSVPDYQVDFGYELNRLSLRNNDTVKIRNGSSGGWQLVKVNAGRIELVAQQSATIQFKSNIYDSQAGGFGIDDRSFELTGFSVDNCLEVRNLYTAFVDMLTTNAGVLVKEFRSAYVDFMNNGLALISLQYSENESLFKTSFISIDHTIRNLDQIPYYVKQPEAILEQYINEMKPYHTKIRRYLSTYPGIDHGDTFSTDFDLPSYLTSEGTYKAPNVDDPVDQNYLESYPAKSWADNYLHEVAYVDVIDGGKGYTSNVVLTFIGGGGSGVKARAKVSNGSIVSVVVDNTGAGFNTPPTILIEGTGSGAVLIARLKNRKVRSITNKITFDRYTYSTTVLEWQPYTEYAVDDVFTYNYAPYRVINNFFSTDKIDLIDAVPYRCYRWQPRTRYSRFDLVVTDWEAGTVYQVDVDHESPAVLTLEYLRNYMLTVGLLPVPYLGVVYDNASDRIWSYYQPATGAPGRSLPQLMSGIEYPGVKVLGPTFDQEPGFDVSNYDTTLWDNIEYDSEGLPIISGAGSLDSTFYSYFTDANLGLRPEDIISDGSGFVDTYSSHAPEELVPGIIYDALDIQVTTISDGDLENDGAGPEVSLSSTFAEQSTSFPYNADIKGGVENIFVWTKKEGYKHKNVDYTVDHINKTIDFASTFADPADVVYAMSLGAAGEAIVADLEYVADGSTASFPLSDIRSSIAKQIYVKVNGEEVEDYMVRWDDSIVSAWAINTQYYINDQIHHEGIVYRVAEDFFSGGAFATTHLEAYYDYYAALVFDTAPAAGDYIQVHVYNQSGLRKAYSSIKEVSYTVSKTGLNPGDPVTYPLDYTFALPETQIYAQPWNSNIIVRVNNEELAPANNTFYTGDGSTTAFVIPMVGSHTANLWSNTDLQVTIDGVSKKINIDYTIYRDGSSKDPMIVFTSAPVAGTTICLSDTSVSDYVFVDANNIRIKSTLFIKDDTATNLRVNDLVTIVQFSNYDMYKQRTQVFKGLTATSTATGGFDAAGFDSVSFDSDTISVVAAPVYTLSRPVTNQDNLMVSLNGAILNRIYDYRIEQGTLLTMDLNLTISSTDVITIRHFGENLRKPTVKFRVFKDMNDNFAFLGIGANQSTTLSSDLNFTDTEIDVVDASKLMEPGVDSNQPGVVFIEGERITYWVRDLENNKLKQIRRSTGGTGGSFHAAGANVVDGGASMSIPDGDKLWYSLVDGGQVGPDGSTLVVKTTGQSLQSIDTPQAAYLRSISR